MEAYDESIPTIGIKDEAERQKLGSELIAVQELLDTSGWKWLEAEIKEDVEVMTDGLIGSGRKEDHDAINILRGKIQYAKLIFDKIDRVLQYKNKL